MSNGDIAREITEVMHRINPRELERVLDSMDASEVTETVRQFNGGVDFFSTPAGKKFYKNGKMRRR